MRERVNIFLTSYPFGYRRGAVACFIIKVSYDRLN